MFWLVMFAFVFAMTMVGYFGFLYVPVALMHLIPVWGMVAIFFQIEDLCVKEEDIIEKSLHIWIILFLAYMTFTFSGHLDVWYKTGALPISWTGASSTMSSNIGKLFLWSVTAVVGGALLSWLLIKLKDYIDKRKMAKLRRE